MELAQSHQGGRRGTRNRFCEKPAILDNGLPAIVGSESEIELARRIFAAVGATGAATPRTEAVPKPPRFSRSILFPAWNRQPLDAVFGDMGRGGGYGKLLRCGTVHPEPPKLSGDAGGGSSTLAHQTRALKEGVDCL